MIKTIVFDFGDVLVVDTTKTLEKKYQFDRMQPSKQKAYIRDFHRSEEGKIPTSRLLKTMGDTLAPKLAPAEIERFILKSKLLPTWELALKLSRRYQVIIFSNNQRTWPAKFEKTLGVKFSRFPFVNSARAGMRKPNPLFYRYLIRRFKLKPEETAFVDDKEKNLPPAQKLGIHTFLYHRNDQALQKFLKKLGVNFS